MSARTFIYDALQADSNITDEVSTRVYMGTGPSETARPYIKFSANMVGDSFTKDKTSTVDEWSVNIDIFHNSIAEAESVGALIYTALQGYKGTLNGVTCQGCKLDDEGDDVAEDIAGELNMAWTQDYQLRIER